MNAHQLVHPWQRVTAKTGAHRRTAVVVTVDAPSAVQPSVHWWTAPTGRFAAAAHHVFVLPQPHTLPDNRSHYYPSRCVYLESSELARMMDHL